MRICINEAARALASIGLGLSTYIHGPALFDVWGVVGGVQPVVAREDASSTFANAEKAMKVTYENFDLANKAWINGGRRLLQDNAGIVSEKEEFTDRSKRIDFIECCYE